MNEALNKRIDKVLATFEKRLETGFAKKDFITFYNSKQTMNVWGATYTELTVAKKMNELYTTLSLVPTEIMKDRKLATEFQRKRSTDIIGIDEDHNWMYETSIDVKYQPRAIDFGTINVEWSFANDLTKAESNIRFSKCNYYCYVTGGKAYLIKKSDLYALAKDLPITQNHHTNFQTKKVKLSDLEAKCARVMELGDHYKEMMERFQEQM